MQILKNILQHLAPQSIILKVDSLGNNSVTACTELRGDYWPF